MSEKKCLIIDIGNSFIKLVLIKQKWLIKPSFFLNANNLAELQAELSYFSKINHSDLDFVQNFSKQINRFEIENFLICSVKTAADKKQIIIDLLAKKIKNEFNFFESGYFEAMSQKKIIIFNKIELINNYDNPLQLGTDRWLASIGALSLNTSNKLKRDKIITVIDFGSVISIDFIQQSSKQNAKQSPSHKNEYCYLGGLLLPNYYLFKQSLAQKMPLKDSPEKPDFSQIKEFGKNTNHCIQSGFLTSIRALLKYHPLICKSESVYLTGGFLALIKKMVIAEFKVNEKKWLESNDLVFLGLLIQAQSYILSDKN